MGQTWESFKVTGDDLLRRVKEILHEGNVRRVVIKQGARTVVEFPVTVGVVERPGRALAGGGRRAGRAADGVHDRGGAGARTPRRLRPRPRHRVSRRKKS